MLKEATIRICLFDESNISNIVLFDYVTIEYLEIIIDCINIGKRSEAAKQPAISANSCAKLSKAKFCLWVSLIFLSCIKHGEFPTE